MMLPISDKYIEVDGQKYYSYSATLAYVDEQVDVGFRWGQAIYNVLYLLRQAGMEELGGWNELYQEPNAKLAMIEFHKHFVVDGDYIIPRNTTASQPAVVTTT